MLCFVFANQPATVPLELDVNTCSRPTSIPESNNKLHPQRGATGDSNTCKTFQPLPPSLRKRSCVHVDSRFNTPVVLLSVALSICETVLVLAPAVALSGERLVFREFLFALILSFALALVRCVLLFTFAIVDHFSLCPGSFLWVESSPLPAA